VATALLFDRDEVDEVEDWPGQVGRLRRSSILWIDLERPGQEEIRELAEGLDLSQESAERLANETDHDVDPYFGDFGEYLHVAGYVPSQDGDKDFAEVECLVSERWVATVHEQPVAVLETFRERAGGSGETGRLDGLEFLANLLEWVLGGYRDAFEEIELALEEVDARAMEGSLAKPEAELRTLVELRHKIGSLRRVLVSHREILLSLTRPELTAIASSGSAERFASLRSRLEDVVQAARDSRESVVGSFDVLIARTEHRTNEIVKVLTLGSLLLLPGSLIAGVMGMNFKLGIFESAGYFWLVLTLMVAVAAATVVVARARRWI
jgi:magnesium transporter